MKVIKDRANGNLARLTNEHAATVIAAKDMLLVGDLTMERFVYSTKGALKSRINTNKKQVAINRRVYFRKRRLNK